MDAVQDRQGSPQSPAFPSVVFLAGPKAHRHWKPQKFIWLVVEPPTPLKNDGVKVSWDDEIPNIWKHHPVLFQTTNQDLMGFHGIAWDFMGFHGISKPPSSSCFVESRRQP